MPPQAPKTLGVEFSGIIESLGNEAEAEFRAGDEVFGLAYGGESLRCSDLTISATRSNSSLSLLWTKEEK